MNAKIFFLGIIGGHQLSDIETYESDFIIFFDILGAMVVRWPQSFTFVINFLVTGVSVFSIMNNIKWAKRNGTVLKKNLHRI